MRAFARLHTLVLFAVFFLTIELTAANHQIKNAEKDDIDFEGDNQVKYSDQTPVEASLLQRLRRGLLDPFEWFGLASSTTQAPPSNIEQQPDPNNDHLEDIYDTTERIFRQNEPNTDDEDGDSFGSGDGRRKPSPVVPTLPGTEKTIRVTFVVMEPYVADFSDHNSQRFQELARSLNDDVNALYDQIPGEQKSNLVRIESRPSDSVTCKVTMDVVTIDNYDIDTIVETLKRRIYNFRRLGDITVSLDEFSYQEFNGPFLDPEIVSTDSRLQCNKNEVQCESGGCILYELLCDGNVNCPDGSDEKNCRGFDQTDEETEQSEDTDTEWPDISQSPVTDSTNYEYDSELSTTAEPHRSVVLKSDGSPCPSYELLSCQNSDVYICNDLRCDGNTDCPGGDDEYGCGRPEIVDSTTEDDVFKEPELEKPSQCGDEELTCDQTRCVPNSQLCDGYSDCRDNTDETNCTASNCSGYFCSSGICLQSSARCNGVVECRDEDDERECPCGLDEYRCGDGACIENRRLCDNVRDCQDASDEARCPTQATLFRCDDGTKISASLKCNRIYDCPDYSDERNCPCGIDDFKCNNSHCIPANRRCDGTNDCQDRSDELFCPGRACARGDWQCSDETCVKAASRCDGHRDCPDFSDEKDCPAIPNMKCAADEFHCDDGQCLPNNERCNGWSACSQGEDEEGCQQPESCYFQCQSDGACIRRVDYCDGKADCRDSSDEESCSCQPDDFRCNNGVCIASYLICNGQNECQDASDEYDCANYNITSTMRPSQCSPYEFRCRTDGSCIQSDFRCDKNYDCHDKSDEDDCIQNCDHPSVYCDGVCHPMSIRCDGQPQCSDQQDEEDCNEIGSCPSDKIQCHDGTCIPTTALCDNEQDCSDGSDEDGCNEGECRDYEWRCTSGECISEGYRCNGHVDCTDGSDEASPPCPELTTRRPYSTLQTYYPTPPSVTTDSPYPPPYVPTESNSPPGSESQTRALQLRTYPSNQTVKTSRFLEGGDVVFHCRDEGPLRAKVKWSKLDGPLPSNYSDVRGRLEMNNIAMSAAGIYICQAVGFRRNLPGVEVSVELKVEHYQSPEIRPAFACDINEATCSNGDCIAKSSICDGKYDCTDGIDEEACNLHALCEPNEYRCANKRCVLRTWLCDSEDDCQDGSDELECRKPLPGERCHPYEFQCKLNDQCVPKSFHCNGLVDCIDGSDELGCREVQVIEPPPSVRILQQYETLNISCRVIGIPTPEVVWRRNWGHIPDKCTSTNYKGFSILVCPDLQVEDSGAYSCEGLNIKGSVIATPDTILQVKPKETGAICNKGFFNSEAKTSEECISCFCFGVTSECKSADLFVFQLPTLLGQGATRLVGVAEVPVKLAEVTEEPISDNFNIVLNYNTVTVNRIGPWSSKNLHPYIILPQDYNGNRLTSYGGYLMYHKNNPRAAANRRASSQLPDIILQGSGIQLISNTHPSYLPQHAGKVEVRLFPQEWKRITLNGPQKATREDLMVLLSNVSSIMIRAEDDGNGLSIADFSMDSASTALTEIRASFVEECRCPEGYTGLSCQKCASGYTKEQINGVINRCVPQAAVCEPGTYGDPQIGVPCIPCPCPHSSPTNQFARTCHLGYDLLPTCDCASGYEGRRCEKCSVGYVGNPIIAGDSCRRDDVLIKRCDRRGTNYSVNDECICKPSATGERCDQCNSNAFYLSEQNQNGCVECFCGGVSNNCDSSTLRRTTIRINLNPSSPMDYARVVLRPPNTLDVVETNITTELRNQELITSDVDGRAPGPYYWELPQSFTGNKLSAYGGFINYTIRHIAKPRSQNLPNNAPDLELVTETFGNLLYYDPKPPSYEGIKSGRVQLVEKYWQSIVGGPVPRQEFLTILSNLNYLLVKATYTTSTSQAALISASMEIAKRDGEGERAWLVEECRCPTGHVGLSCEKCSAGYTRDDGGLHFGNCMLCSCNGRSEQCHPETGECINCADNFAGKTCEECASGYYSVDGVCVVFPQNTASCRCNEAGSRGGCRNGECECKANVVGEQCNQCRPGTFNLQPWNLDGCKACYCSGVSQTCQQGYGWRREQIPTVIVPNGLHEFVLMSWENKNIIRTGFQAKSELNQISYEFGDFSRRETYYWSLPRAFTGDKITSYGGNLTITQKFESPYDRLSSDGLDVILVGDQKTIFWSGILRQPVNKTFSYVVTLREEFWNIVPGSGELRPIAHYDFMGVLASLRQVLVRATLSTSTRRTFISDISMDTAIQSENGGNSRNLALDVEVCTCPPGYYGTSCELCANLHYRDRQGQCVACPCQDNARGCSLDRSGDVICDCIPPYNGRFCTIIDIDNQHVKPTPPSTRDPKITAVITNRVLDIQVGKSAHWSCTSKGYQSNAPVTINWRREGGDMPYGRVLQDKQTGDLTIYDVEESDSGTYVCEAFDGVAYATERAILTVSGNTATVPEVYIKPSFIEVYEGEPIELTCKARGNPVPKLKWLRTDRRSIAPYVFQDGVFRIDAAQDADKGEYRCIAQNTQGSVSAVSVINIMPRDSSAESVPRLTTIPSSELILSQGESSIIRCYAEHTTIDSRLITWTRENGKLPRTFTSYGDELRIVDAQPRDTGVYTCYVKDSISPAAILVSVQAVYEDTTPLPGDQPKVTVDELNVTVPEGESIVINCTASGNPYPTIRWRKANGRLGDGAEQRGDSLVISNAKTSDADLYICEGLSYDGTSIAQAPCYITISRREKPMIEIWPKDNMQIRIGEGAALQCTVKAGIPEPKVTWTRSDGSPFTPRTILEPGNVIRIHNATLNDDGQYICTVSNEVGTVTARTHVAIVADPVISIFPESYIVAQIGQEINVECRVQGHPPPTVSWRKETNYVGSAESYGARLHFPRVQLSDSGTYTCIADNLASTREEKIMIYVDEESGSGYLPGSETPPRGAYTGATPLSYHAVEGGPAKLQCRATPRDPRNNKPYTIDWVRSDGRPFPPNARITNNVLSIDKVSVADAGDYQCRLLVGGIPQVVVTSTLAVDRLPSVTLRPVRQIVRPGDTVNLLCDATGDEPIKLRWRPEFGGFPSRVQVRGSRGESLVFYQIEVQDAGEYVCEATNKVGTATATAMVLVRADDQIRDRKVLISPPATPPFVGDSLKVDCRATSSDIDVSWYGPDNTYYNQQKYSSGSSLLLDNISQKQAGVFYCRGQDNNRNEYRDEFSLVVQATPASIRNASNQVLYAPLGSHIILPCMTNLDGQLQYEWRRQDGYMPLTIDSNQPQVEIFKVSEQDAGAYICRVSNGRINMASRVVLKVSNVIPQFNGDSFISLPTLRDVYQEFNIEIVIKPLHGSGIMLYISERSGRDTGDMISLALVEGFPEFKFDTGNGPVTVRGDTHLELDQWHTININRKEKDGFMYVDGNGPFTGSSFGRYSMMNFIKQPLYIGGVPDYNQLSADFVNRTGYIGCISRLVLGDKEISLMSQKYTVRRNIENCDSCDPNPCLSDGVCQDFSNERGYTCICAEGFSGTNCSRVGEICKTDVCGPGRCHESKQGIKCICPIGYVGDRCEERRDIEYPGFSGGAYLAYKPTIPNLQIKLRLQVKPSSPVRDGIIMYASENRYGHGGFVALVVKDRHIEFRLNTGEEFVILRSRSTLRENVWTDIIISRVFGICKITINGQLEKQTILKNKSKNLKLNTPMYVGGFDDDSVTINNKTEVFVGFNGCVKDVLVQDKALDIVKSSIKAANVQECNVNIRVPHRGDIPVIPTASEAEYENVDCSQCVHGSCRSQATICACDNGYEGRLCDVRADLYQRAIDRCAVHPCGDGGACEPTQEGTYRCNCHLGYSGFHCQTPLLIRQDFQLNGNSYVELPASLRDRDMQLIALAFTSRLDDGVLLYQGGDRLGDQQDFILLTIEHGFVKLEWELGSGVGLLTADTFVSDGKRHQLVVLRRGREMQLTVDSNKIVGSSPGYQTELNVKSNIFVGGVPNAVHNGSLRGITGCVEQIEFGSGPIDIGKTAVSSKNIVPCNNIEANDIGSDHQY